MRYFPSSVDAFESDRSLRNVLTYLILMPAFTAEFNADFPAEYIADFFAEI